MPTFPISSHSMGASHWSPAALLASVRALPVLAHAGAKVVVGDIDIDGAARVATEIGGQQCRSMSPMPPMPPRPTT